jgi:hypothetical protein
MLLCGCLLAVAVQAQESKRDFWTWKDANGVTQFSDRPVPGARRITIYSSSAAPAAGPVTGGPAPAATAAPDSQAAASYQSLEIWSPASGESFFGTDAAVIVRLRSEPSLAPKDRLLLYLDGKLVEGSANSYDYTLANLERGAHSLSAVIVDAAGEEKIRSAPRVFHVKLPTINEPRAVGPALKPPPKPQPRSN